MILTLFSLCRNEMSNVICTVLSILSLSLKKTLNNSYCLFEINVALIGINEKYYIQSKYRNRITLFLKQMRDFQR